MQQLKIKGASITSPPSLPSFDFKKAKTERKKHNSDFKSGIYFILII
jgi:hypothetical protein